MAGLVLAMLLAACAGSDGDKPKPTTTTEAATTTTTTAPPLDLLRVAGGMPTQPDTIEIEGGPDDLSVTVSYPGDEESKWLEDLMAKFDMPAATIRLIEATRPIDGVQSIDGPKVSARWSVGDEFGSSTLQVTFLRKS